MKTLVVCPLVFGLLVGAPHPGLAQGVPPYITYIGDMTDSAGEPVTDALDLTFRLYGGADPTSFPEPLWQETQADIAIQEGRFVAYLGSAVPFGAQVFAGAERWLSIAIGDGAEMQPRFQLVSVPFAMRAAECDALQGHTAADFLLAGGPIAGADVQGPVDQCIDADTLDGRHAADFEPTGSVAAHDAARGHLTPAQAVELTAGGQTALHSHAGLPDDVNWQLLTSVFDGRYACTELPADIPDAYLGGVELLVAVPDVGTLRNLTVDIGITHPDVGELAVTLTGPAGQVVTLHNRGDAGTAGLGYNYDVDRTPADDPLAMNAFDGTELAGEWHLRVIDYELSNVGTVDEFAVVATYLSGDTVQLAGNLRFAGDEGAGADIGLDDDGGLRLTGGNGAQLSLGSGGTDAVYANRLVIGSEAGAHGALSLNDDGSLDIRTGSGGHVTVGGVGMRPGRIWEYVCGARFTPADIAADESSVFLAGDSYDDGVLVWRIERLASDTGALVWSVRNAASAAAGGLTAIAVRDSSPRALYVAGRQRNGTVLEGRIEYRAVSSGTQQGAVSLGAANFPKGLATLPNGVVLVGQDATTADSRWYVRKWNENLQDTGGWNVDINPSSNGGEEPTAVFTDGTGVYVAGSDYALGLGDAQWRIEKRSLVDGSLMWSQPRLSNPTTGYDCPLDLTGDDEGLYMVGRAAESGAGYVRVEKRDPSSGGLLWFHALPPDTTDHPTQVRIVLLPEGLYFVGSGRQCESCLLFVRFDPGSGEEIDRFLRYHDGTDVILASAALGGREVFTAGSQQLYGDGLGFVDRLSFLQGGLSVDGDFLASGAKSFAIPHPLRPGGTLVHACIEGPEAAVYYRGEARLTAGSAEVLLPDYFEALTRKDGRTVLLTPVGGADPIYVEPAGDGALVAGGRFVVRSTDVASDQRFVWEVRAVRADLPPLAVER